MSDVPQVRVLFLHGLESAPSAKVGKIPDLKASFVDVCCPDLHTGRAQFNRKNSILRCLLRSAALRAAVASSALSLLGALAGRLPLGLAAAGVLAPFAFVLATYKTLLLPNAVEASVVASLAVARAALIAFKPDVVVGSSWGGALATLLVHEGAWTGPLALLAPAGSRISLNMRPRSALGRTLQQPLPPQCRGIVVHGTKDTVVPLKDSRALCAQSPKMVVRSVEDGHALALALRGRALARLVAEAAALHP
jgi:pimeloyl-ACP methyl ester carboxylesterase